MNLSYLVMHHEISDEAAAHLSEIFNDLATAYVRSNAPSAGSRS